jgi:hypothetical protein
MEALREVIAKGGPPDAGAGLKVRLSRKHLENALAEVGAKRAQGA